MDKLVGLFVERNQTLAEFSKKVLDRVNQEINDYNFAFDLSETEGIQMEVDKLMSSGEKPPEIKPDYIPPPLLMTIEIKENTTKKNEDFIKISLVVKDEKIKAESDIADQKTKKLIKDIVNPTPGILTNDTFDPKKRQQR